MLAMNIALRFGVVDGNQRAATWHLRYQISAKSGLPELYLLCRELRGAIHASMHPTGQWHVAYPEHVFNRDIKEISPIGTDRYIQKWTRPKELKPGITLAFHIITPSSAVKTAFVEDGRTIIKIPRASENKATDIMILIVGAQTTIHTIKNAHEVGAIQMNNGEKVLVIHREIDIPTPFRGTLQVSPRYLKGRSKDDLVGVDLSAIAFGEVSDGSRLIWDCAVTRSVVK